MESPGPMGSTASDPQNEPRSSTHRRAPLPRPGTAGQGHGPRRSLLVALRSPCLCLLPRRRHTVPSPITRPGPHGAVSRHPSQGLHPWRWIFLSRITMIIIHFCIINYHLRNWFIPMHKLRVEKVLPLRSASPSPLLTSPQQGELQGQVLTRWPCSTGAVAPSFLQAVDTLIDTRPSGFRGPSQPT